MTMREKIAITERAIVQRINRKLKPDQEQLCKARGWR